MKIFDCDVIFDVYITTADAIVQVRRWKGGRKQKFWSVITFLFEFNKNVDFPCIQGGFTNKIMPPLWFNVFTICTFVCVFPWHIAVAVRQLSESNIMWLLRVKFIAFIWIFCMFMYVLVFFLEIFMFHLSVLNLYIWSRLIIF